MKRLLQRSNYKAAVIWTRPVTATRKEMFGLSCILKMKLMEVVNERVVQKKGFKRMISKFWTGVSV